MSRPEETFPAQVRQLLVDASDRIHPSRPAPAPGTAGPATALRPRPVTPRLLTIAFVLLLVVAVIALTISFQARSRRPAGMNEIPGSVVAIQADTSAVVVMNPNTGHVERTLVRASPVYDHGTKLSGPFELSAGGGYAYLAYEEPSPSIYRVPLEGGALSRVADGELPAVNQGGTELAYVGFSGGSASSGYTTEQVMIRDLATGSVHSVYEIEGADVVNGLSWSPDDRELVMSLWSLPISEGDALSRSFPGLRLDVEVLNLDKPISANTASPNPRVLVKSVPSSGGPDLSNAQFVDSGTVSVLRNPISHCEHGPTDVLAVNAHSGATSVLAEAPLIASAVDFESGQIALLDGSSSACPSPTGTGLGTVPSTKPGRGSLSSESSFYVITGNPKEFSLYKWNDGTPVRIATGILTSVLVP
jgi:hypothetical protein